MRTVFFAVFMFCATRGRRTCPGNCSGPRAPTPAPPLADFARLGWLPGAACLAACAAAAAYAGAGVQRVAVAPACCCWGRRAGAQLNPSPLRKRRPGARRLAGLLYQRLTLAVPHAVVFDEIGAAAAGRAGSAAVFALIYTSIACQPVILHLMSAVSLREVRRAAA